MCIRDSDTSVMLHWLKHSYQCEIIAYCADVGQGQELLGLEEKALKTGASKVHIVDLREDFAGNFVFTALKAQAKYEENYLLGTALARPLIAKKHIEIALLEGADTVAHGATGKGNDQIRFELTYHALLPRINVIAPWRIWPFKSRHDLLNYAHIHEIPVEASLEKPYSIDRNLMHTSYEGGILEDPWVEAPEAIFQSTKSIKHAPDEPEYVEISFAQGRPVAVNGQSLKPCQLIEHLNQLGAKHGVGRIDIVENRFVGIKSRGVYETPGLTILNQAHRALESITVDREALRLRDNLSVKISEIIYYGFWFSPEFKIIQAMLDEMQKPVNGDVRIKLHKGNCIIAGRQSQNSLYTKNLASFDNSDTYNHADASGFIKLNALRLMRGGDHEIVG